VKEKAREGEGIWCAAGRYLREHGQDDDVPHGALGARRGMICRRRERIVEQVPARRKSRRSGGGGRGGEGGGGRRSPQSSIVDGSPRGCAAWWPDGRGRSERDGESAAMEMGKRREGRERIGLGALGRVGVV
jgi:hypothetical protein